MKFILFFNCALKINVNLINWIERIFFRYSFLETKLKKFLLIQHVRIIYIFNKANYNIF
jgi:hypothetical protein